MEGVGAFLHLASWWCKSTCCRRSGVMANLGGFLLDIDMAIERRPHNSQQRPFFSVSN